MMFFHVSLPEVSGYTMPGYKLALEGAEASAKDAPEEQTRRDDIEEEDGGDEIGGYSQLVREKEKQISVDPVSLKQLVTVEGHVSSVPAISTGVGMPAPVLLPGMRPKFISSSLPCSATSSPHSDTKNTKKWRDAIQKPPPAVQSLARQHSLALSHFASQQEPRMHRSKSCGDRRSCAPSDEFDILARRPSFHRPENGVQVLYECSDNASDTVNDGVYDTQGEQAFKCSALCLFLPGLSRKKQVAAVKAEKEEQGSPVSRTVSLEKFECGSWSSAMIIDGDDDDSGGIQSYFDLPLELIRCSTNDPYSPVKTAFVFERDRKGVLKKSTSKLTPRKSHESSNRHVRFSTSAPTSYPPSPTSSCITPRLRKAREEFNAFLEAQSA